MLEFVVLTTLYLTGVLMTARHRVYRIKLRNEQETYLGVRVGPRVMRQSDYLAIRMDRFGRTRGDYGQRDLLPRSDYRDLLFNSFFFPVYWILGGGYLLVKTLVFGGLPQTPGEKQEERRRRDQEILRLEADLYKNKKGHHGIL